MAKGGFRDVLCLECSDAAYVIRGTVVDVCMSCARATEAEYQATCRNRVAISTVAHKGSSESSLIYAEKVNSDSQARRNLQNLVAAHASS